MLGLIRVRQSRAHDAEALFQQSIAAAPQQAGARLNLGILYIDAGRLEEAAVQFEAALRIAPGNRETAAHLVTALRGLAAAAITGDPEKALSHLVRARALVPTNPDVLFEFAMAALRLTLHEDAIPALVKALEHRPNEPKFLYALARARMALGDLMEAERLFKQYTTLRPEDPTGHYGLGYVLAGQKRSAEARVGFERSLALRPEQTESNYHLGLLDLADGKLDDAATRFEIVLARFADHTGALVGLGQVYFSRKQFDQARKSLERAVALDPALVKAHYQLGLTAARQGDQETFRRELELAAKLEQEQKQNRRTVLRLLESPLGGQTPQKP